MRTIEFLPSGNYISFFLASKLETFLPLRAAAGLLPFSFSRAPSGRAAAAAASTNYCQLHLPPTVFYKRAPSQPHNASCRVKENQFHERFRIVAHASLPCFFAYNLFEDNCRFTNSELRHNSFRFTSSLFLTKNWTMTSRYM
jgi:hypothetical protein